MNRVEHTTDASGAAYTQFQRAALLEEEVQRRTKELEHALDLLNESNARLALANAETESARSNLANALEAVQEGFALFDKDDCLVMCNSRFGMHMPDVHQKLLPGLQFSYYVKLLSESEYLALPKHETAQEWAQKRLIRHSEEHVMFNVQFTENRSVQVSEHHIPDGGTVILQTDVTDIMRIEREERERMLDSQAQVIRATLEHLNQGIGIFDAQTRLVFWNKKIADMLPLPLVSLRVGTSFETVLSHLDITADFTDDMTLNDLREWITHRSERPPLRFEISHSGMTILDVYAQEMPNSGFVISLTDVTAEKNAVRALSEANETLEHRVMARTLELEDALAVAERANASKSRFVAAASHDLLQPLSAAKLYIASLESELTEPQNREIVDKANRSLQSVEHILEALLDISKLDSGRASVHVDAVPLGVILDQLRDELAPIAAQKGIDLRLVSTCATVISDATYLRRILQNLLGNAIRYTDKGKVLVGVRRKSQSYRVQIWDTGPGIPEDKQNTIFGEFQRLNASASAAEGMGLGLAIVERACALLNHPLELKSTLGKGTVFSIDLCAAPKTNSSGKSAASITQQKGMRPLHNLVFLLIENDPDVQTALTHTLESWGASVLVAPSGTEAAELLDEIDLSPDIIIADYQLDNAELGTEAIQTLRQDRGTIPSMVITANRSQEVALACKALGVGLIYKPIDPQVLRAYVDRCVQSLAFGSPA